MTGWLENERKKRAEQVAAMEFSVGDLVQGIGNFADIWYEIISITRYDGESMPVYFSSVTHVAYSKYGNERWTESLRFSDIRRVAKKEDVNPNRNIISLRGQKSDPFRGVVVWPNDNPKGYSNTREHHPDFSPDTIGR